MIQNERVTDLARYSHHEFLSKGNACHRPTITTMSASMPVTRNPPARRTAGGLVTALTQTRALTFCRRGSLKQTCKQRPRGRLYGEGHISS